MVEHILGHDKYISNGIVPLLIVGIANELIDKYPKVRFYAYGTFWGARETMQRFKKKFKFMPHKVIWEYGSPMDENPTTQNQNRKQFIYKTRRDVPFPIEPNNMKFHVLQHTKEAFSNWSSVPMKGFFEKFKLAAKLFSKRRIFIYVTQEDKLLHTTWLSLGFCRHYRVAKTEVVIGPIWTPAAGRNKGVATLTMKLAMNLMIEKGSFIFLIDTSENNFPCQKVISKCEFGEPISHYGRVNNN